MPAGIPHRPHRNGRKGAPRGGRQKPQPGPYAGVPPNGGGSPHTVVYGTPKPEKRHWIRTVMTGALTAGGAILAYRLYAKIKGKDAPGDPTMSTMAAMPNPMQMGMQPQQFGAYPVAGLSALGAPPSPSLNAALAMQNLLAQQQMMAVRAAEAARPARRVNPAPAPKAPAEPEPEMTYMDEFMQQFDDE